MRCMHGDMQDPGSRQNQKANSRCPCSSISNIVRAEVIRDATTDFQPPPVYVPIPINRILEAQVSRSNSSAPPSLLITSTQSLKLSSPVSFKILHLSRPSPQRRIHHSSPRSHHHQLTSLDISQPPKSAHPPASAPPPTAHARKEKKKEMHLFSLLLAALALTLAAAMPVPTNDGEDGDTGDNYVQCLAQCNGNSTPCLTNAKNDDSVVLGVTFMWYVLVRSWR